MWWKDYTDDRPRFVKAFNAKTHINREPLTDDLERMAWNYHYSYLYRQMIYERSEGWGNKEVILKLHEPSGSHLPALIETENNRPVTEEILKQRANHEQMGFYAPVDLFQNPFNNAAECPARSDLTLY